MKEEAQIIFMRTYCANFLLCQKHSPPAFYFVILMGKSVTYFGQFCAKKFKIME